MALEERLVDRHVLEPDDALPLLQLENAIDEQEGVTMRQDLQNVFDGVHSGLPDSVLHERTYQGNRAPMTRFVSDDARPNARTGQHQIADAVERLVPDEFVGPAEGGIHDPRGVEHDRVRRRCP